MFIQPWYAHSTPTSAAPKRAQFTPSQLARPRRAEVLDLRRVRRLRDRRVDRERQHDDEQERRDLHDVMTNCSPPPSRVPRALTAASPAMTSAVRSCRGQNGSTSTACLTGVERLLEHVVERLGEHGRQRRDGRRADDPELDPAPEEPGHPAVAFAEEDVVAAGPREQDRDLGERQRPEQREHAAEDPHGHRQAELGDVLGDVAALLEDARADDGADDDGGRDPRPEDAGQGLRLSGLHEGR